MDRFTCECALTIARPWNLTCTEDRGSVVSFVMIHQAVITLHHPPPFCFYFFSLNTSSEDTGSGGSGGGKDSSDDRDSGDDECVPEMSHCDSNAECCPNLSCILDDTLSDNGERKTCPLF